MGAAGQVLPLASPIYDAKPVAAEEILWRGTPSTVVLIGAVVWVAIVLIGAAIFARMLPQEQRGILWIGAAVLVGFFVLRALFSYLRIVSTLYTVTNQRVMIETGMLSKRLAEIDLRYIDESQFSQGVVERMLGIGNVTLISSDTTMPTYTLHGIKDPRGVRELIRSHAYQVSQRQLFTRST